VDTTVDPLRDLLRDESPLVRYHAVQAAEVNWDADFIEPVQKLLRDPHKEIAGMASICLYNHESPDRPSLVFHKPLEINRLLHR
jgi:hypothetical protein